MNTIKNLTVFQQKEILISLGVSINENSSQIQQCCPVHGGDNTTAFSYNFDKSIWSCFTHKCNKIYGNDIIGLVKGIKSCSFYEACDYINNILNLNADVYNYKTESSFKNLHFLKTLVSNTKNIPIEISERPALVKNHDFLLNKQISSQTAEMFNGGIFSISYKDYHYRYMLPIVDIDNQTVGYTGRILWPTCNLCGAAHNQDVNCPMSSEKFKYAKWRHYPQNIKTSLTLFNINNAKQHIQTTKNAILVEGPIDTIKLWDSGVYNIISSFGTTLSKRQVELLINTGCINLIIMYDGDIGGRKGTNLIVKEYSRYFNITPILLEENKDPDDLSQAEIHNLCDRYIKILK